MTIEEDAGRKRIKRISIIMELRIKMRMKKG